MPVQNCPRCRRANPELAIYCYFDGFELRAPTDGVAYRMPTEFVFPSGRRCRTYDEFAQGCQEEWSAARDLLHQGMVGKFFGNCGRADLVRAAQDANAQGSPDAALATFLASLPGVRTQTPRLDINPRRVLLGNLLAGETRQLPVTITNAGQGSLQGTASITEGQDLVRLADGQAVFEVPVDTPRQQQITLYLNTRGLPANQGHGAKLTVVTNGGVAEVPLRLELIARPFPAAPFQGVKAQRELAERMRQQPKAGVPLLESGEVRRWFEANGWTYPVAGPEVRGVAAVQQFFEALGLSKPPTVQLSSTEVRLRCKYPDSARYQLTLSTPAKKWVYATITSDSAWLKVPQPQTSGPQQSTFLIEVDSSRMTSVGSHGEGKVLLVANGGQKVEVRVVADVSGMPNARPAPMPVPVPAPPSVPAAMPAMRAGLPPVPTAGFAAPPSVPHTPTPRNRSSFIASLLILPLLFLGVRLVLAPVADGFLRGAAVRSAANRLSIKVDPDSPVGGLAGWLRLPWPSIMLAEDTGIPAALFDPANRATVPAADFRDYFVSSFTRTLVLMTWWLAALAGGALLWRRSGVLDAPWGFIAGAVAGLAGMATLACAFLVVELIPQFIWHVVTRDSGGPLGWFGYELLALLIWLALGVGAGIAAAMLPPVRRLVLLPLQRLPAAIFQGMGLRAVAHFWWTPAG
jgi:hypothetical protein